MRIISFILSLCLMFLPAGAAFAEPLTVEGATTTQKDAERNYVTSVEDSATGLVFHFKDTEGPGYRIFRSNSAAEKGESITDFFITQKSFPDENMAVGTTYYYRIYKVEKEADPKKDTDEVLSQAYDAITAKHLAAPKEDTEKPVNPENPNNRPDPSADNNANEIDTVGEDPSSVSTGKPHVMVLTIGSTVMTVDTLPRDVDPGRSTAPKIRNNRTLVPIRAVVEAMAGSAAWKGAEEKITLIANGNTVVMWVGRDSLIHNGQKRTIDTPPMIKAGRTYVPLRFAAESLGCKVDWNGANRSITISWTGQVKSAPAPKAPAPQPKDTTNKDTPPPKENNTVLFE